VGMLRASLATAPQIASAASSIGAHVAPGIAPTVIIFFVGFGLLAGTGIGFGYASATPAAVKWFPPSRTGLIAGLVVSGFGLASVYIAPLTEYLLNRFGVLPAMLFYSLFFVVVVCGLSLLLVNPPQGYVPGAASTTVGAVAK